jgi:hypothetical protein
MAFTAYFINPICVGNHSLIAGINVTSINTTIMAKYKGIMGLITFSIDVFATEQLTNNTEPTGGEHKPIDKFNTIIMPK